MHLRIKHPVSPPPYKLEHVMLDLKKAPAHLVSNIKQRVCIISITGIT